MEKGKRLGSDFGHVQDPLGVKRAQLSYVLTFDTQRWRVGWESAAVFEVGRIPFESHTSPFAPCLVMLDGTGK